MSSTVFVRQVFTWLHQVNGDHELPASSAKVAIYLSSMFNEEEDGAAWPSTETIGEAIGRAASNVVRTLEQLEARGHLRVVWGKQGRGHSSRYWMIVKPSPAKVSEIVKPSPAKVSAAPKTSVSDSENLCFDHVKPLPAQETLSKNSSKEPSKPRARDADFKKTEGKGRSGVNGASVAASVVETDAERMRRWWAMVGDWVQHDESGWPFRDWGPRPGDINCEIPDSVLMEWLISLESPRTSWHVKNALRLLEQSYLTARPRDVKEGAA